MAGNILLTPCGAFEVFVETELNLAVTRFDQEAAAVYIYCHRTPPQEPSRRVLVITEANRGRIAVCIEATYGLFEGDIHHYVRQIGTVSHEDALSKLEPLAREAYEIVMAWKPSFVEIGEYAFLPN